MEFRINRVWDRVQSAIDDQPVEMPSVPQLSPAQSRVGDRGGGRRRVSLAVGMTAAVLAVFFAIIVYRHRAATSVQVLARIENSGNSILGEFVQASMPDGTTLILADGSRVEMRSQSELRLERATDGVRINLTRGSIIVAAAKQGSGHLYVRTN